jgi:hypothetical protein
MGDSISFDLGSAVPYIVENLLALVGRDADSKQWRVELDRLARLSAQQASHVQCVGMPQPIPIRDIYQPLGIQIIKGQELRRVTFEELIGDESALIFAGPGRGKTTLLHWAYMKMMRSTKHLPILFTLRWSNGPALLNDFVSALAKGRSATKGSRTLMLLVDGYDEIDEEKRQIVSQALLLYKSLGIGRFYLTCRSHYDVYDLKVQHAQLSPFVHEDAVRFVSAYCAASDIDISAEGLLQELYEYGFQDFASHPLMLALVCVLQSGPEREIPRRAIGLVERAVQTLTLRWDQSKGVRRGSDLPLDGYERVRCLSRIAFDMAQLEERWDVVEGAVRRHIKLLQFQGIDPRLLLREIAQWYGLLVPSSPETWQFVHKTIHDYLAARFWVDSGGFGSTDVSHWNTRASYAACLLPDATKKLIDMLTFKGSMPHFRECLYNRAAFDPEEVAEAVLHWIDAHSAVTFVERENAIKVDIKDDFFGLSSNEFLRALTCAGDLHLGDAGLAVSLYSIGELVFRKQTISAKNFRMQLLSLLRRAHNIPVELNRSPGLQVFRLSDVVTA